MTDHELLELAAKAGRCAVSASKTVRQIPMPMDDKIEAWVQRAMVLSRHCQDAWGRIDFGEQDNDEAERAELEAHLRTTPEGFVLVPVEPTEAMLQAEIDAVSDYWFDHEELGNRTEATKIGYKAMLAASQENSNA